MKNLNFILLLGLISCKPIENSFEGRYDRYWDFENYTSLQLQPNNTFVFKGQEGVGFIGTEGKWKAEGRHLILTSYPDTSRQEPSIVISERVEKSDSVQIKVFDNEGKLLPGVTILAFAHGDTIVADYTKEEGLVSFAKQPYDSISFLYIGFTPLTYIGKSDRLEIKMGLSEEETPFRFESEKWLIKGNRLFDPRFKEYRSKNKYRKKTNR